MAYAQSSSSSASDSLRCAITTSKMHTGQNWAEPAAAYGLTPQDWCGMVNATGQYGAIGQPAPPRRRPGVQEAPQLQLVNPPPGPLILLPVQQRYGTTSDFYLDQGARHVWQPPAPTTTIPSPPRATAANGNNRIRAAPEAKQPTPLLSPAQPARVANTAAVRHELSQLCPRDDFFPRCKRKTT